VGVPDLFELGSELGPLRWIGTPLHTHFNTADSIVKFLEKDAEARMFAHL
jgi:hypothetical protein